LSAQTTLITTISFGYPPQELQILLDTGSSLFWVIDDTGCEGVVKGIMGQCPGQNKYNYRSSSTFRPMLDDISTSYAYGGGQIPNTAITCRLIGYDDISFGFTAEKHYNHPICAADNVKLANSYVLDLPYDGIMGLAPRPDDRQAIVYVGNTFIPEYGSVSFWYNRALLQNINDDGQFGYVDTGKDVGYVVFGDDDEYNLLYDSLITSY
jgi:hypothetical protein